MRPLRHWRGDCKRVQPVGKTVWRFPKHEKWDCHMTQYAHFWVFVRRK